MLGGCGTILDPAPFAPTSQTTFSHSADAQTQLKVLSKEYDAERNKLMRQQLLFDLPLFGLAAATVASGIYGGSKGLTLGLGLGSAALGGGRLYFGPQTRVAAYNKASTALTCAASVAGHRARVVIITRPDPDQANGGIALNAPANYFMGTLQGHITNVQSIGSMPAISAEIDNEALQRLLADPNVAKITRDVPVPTLLMDSISAVGATTQHKAGFTGVDTSVAILDTGIFPRHTA